MFRRIWAASELAHDVLRFAPTNIILAAIHTRRGLKWGIPAMLLAVPYGLVIILCRAELESGGPGWFNLIVLLAAWNMLKFLLIGPVSIVLLVRARLREHGEQRRERRVDRETVAVDGASLR